MLSIRPLAAILLPFLLGACATATPSLPANAGVAVPARWAEAVPGGGGNLARWWRVFDDPVLVQLVEDAMAASTDVGIAQANLRAARAAREQAASALWPQVSLGASAERSGLAGGRLQNAFRGGFDASWEADVFGGTRHGIAAQQALAGASAATLASTRVSIAAEVAQTYLQLRGAQVRAAVAAGNLASQQETLQISEWRLQAGLANAVEVEQARTAVEQTRAQLPVLQAAAAQFAHALGVLTGRTPEALLPTLAAAAALPQATEALAVDVPAVALRQRPDVLAAERQLRAAAERVGQADAARYPGVQLTGSLAWAGLTLGSLGSVSAARSLVASVAQPLFDAGSRNAQLAQSEAAFDAAREAYRASVLAALQDVEDALVALSSARARVAAWREGQQAAQQAELLASERYASGLIDFQTVLDTQRTLLSVQDSLATAETDLAASHVRLYKALGGGWQPAACGASS